MSKKEKTECQKCKNNHFCDEHHVLPKGIFGDGDTDYLCKNCHDEFHRFLGFKYLRKKNKQDEGFYLSKYHQWLIGLCIAATLIIWYY